MIEAVAKVAIYRQKVLQAKSRKQARILYRLGKYVMSTMQRSMRYGKGASSPGEPPRAHKPNPGLRKDIGFIVDERAGSVSIGPGMQPKRRLVKSAKPFPELLDAGGTATIATPRGVTTASYAPRPFTAPAFATGQQRFFELIEDTPL
jgi:hypothetical protein